MEGGSAKERTERARRLPVYAEAECKRIEKIINNKEKISAGEEKRKPKSTFKPHENIFA